MKYIDENLLRKDIDNWKKAMADAVGEYSDGVRFALEHFTFVLDSLQQEQRETDGDDGKFVKISVRKELAEQIQRLGDEIQAGQSSFVGAMNQQEQPNGVLIPKWCLENIENTLRIQHNINSDLKGGETCQDRNIKESLNCVRKLLNGEEITGRERLEPLMEQPEDLEKAALNFGEEIGVPVSNTFMQIARHFYELGLKAKK